MSSINVVINIISYWTVRYLITTVAITARELICRSLYPQEETNFKFLGAAAGTVLFWRRYKLYKTGLNINCTLLSPSIQGCSTLDVIDFYRP